MWTLLDTIKRTPKNVGILIEKSTENNQKALEVIKEKLGNNISEIIFVGSGSSYNSVMSAKGFVERATNIRVCLETPQAFLYNHNVYPKDALYIFVSQSGNSITTRKALNFIKDKGYCAIAVSADKGTYMTKEADASIDMMCADEEYLMVTLGYCSCIVAIELFALDLGKQLGNIECTKCYHNDLLKAVGNWDHIIDVTTNWFEKAKDKVMNSNVYAVYGIGDLWGTAHEGALKIMEIAKEVGFNYELEEGLHGPTMSFSDKLCIFVLNDGKHETKMAKGLASFLKDVYNKGFIVGNDTVADDDIALDIKSENFANIEIACAMQTVCWLMSQAKGVDLDAPFDTKEAKYFNTHDENDK